MNTLQIQIADGPENAPSYRGGDFLPAELKNAVIVTRGTVAGKATVDLVFAIKDEDGNLKDLAVTMVTGEILKGLALAVEGAENR